MRSKIVFAVALFFTSFSMADYTGKWHGTSRAWDNKGWKAACDDVDYEVSQSRSDITIEFSGTTCGDLTMDPYIEQLLIRGTKLYGDGQEVGEFSENVINVHIEELKGSSPPVVMSTNYQFVKHSDSRATMEKTITNGTEYLKLKADLKRTR